MKKTILVSLLSLLAFAGCKNDVNILAPYKDITVVYGLLDQSDSIHYIRVNKAFEGVGNAYTMAQQFDSINYPVKTITVQLLDYSNGKLVNTYTLDTTSAIHMDSGIFSYPHQVLYKTPAKLNLYDQYTLVVINEKTGKVSKGSTWLLPDVGFSSPNYFFTTSPMPFNFNAYLNTVIWQSNAQALIYQLTFRFYYNEIDTVKKDTAYKYVDWVFAQHTSSSLEAGYQMEDDYSGPAFLQFLKGSISPVAHGVPIKRVPGNIEVLFTSGSSDLQTYIQLSQPSLGINQDNPLYSDVTNAVGLFTARHTQSIFKPIPGNALDSLVTSHTVSQINFQSH